MRLFFITLSIGLFAITIASQVTDFMWDKQDAIEIANKTPLIIVGR